MQTASKDIAGEEQGQSNTNVMCRLCFVGENEGCERARRMLSCKSCGKKYHRNCLKNWAQNRGTILRPYSCDVANGHRSHMGLYLQIYFIGARGSAHLVEFVRYSLTCII